MIPSFRWHLVVPAALALAVTGCRTAPRASAAGEVTSGPAPVSTPAATPAPDTGRGAAADVRFLQRMMGHHAQALTMAALVPARTPRPELRSLAERITISQRDEMALMRRWLQAHGQAVPDTGSHAMHDMHDMPGMQHDAMPGMLSPEELARLGQATGPAFERLFLESMIRHHEGALTMVAELFATPGAAQDPEIFRLASDVDADQRAEIRRMRGLLAAAPTSSTP